MASLPSSPWQRDRLRYSGKTGEPFRVFITGVAANVYNIQPPRCPEQPLVFLDTRPRFILGVCTAYKCAWPPHNNEPRPASRPTFDLPPRWLRDPRGFGETCSKGTKGYLYSALPLPEASASR